MYILGKLTVIIGQGGNLDLTVEGESLQAYEGDAPLIGDIPGADPEVFRKMKERTPGTYETVANVTDYVLRNKLSYKPAQK